MGGGGLYPAISSHSKTAQCSFLLLGLRRRVKHTAPDVMRVLLANSWQTLWSSRRLSHHKRWRESGLRGLVVVVVGGRLAWADVHARSIATKTCVLGQTESSKRNGEKKRQVVK